MLLSYIRKNYVFGLIGRESRVVEFANFFGLRLNNCHGISNSGLVELEEEVFLKIGPGVHTCQVVELVKQVEGRIDVVFMISYFRSPSNLGSPVDSIIIGGKILMHTSWVKESSSESQLGEHINFVPLFSNFKR